MRSLHSGDDEELNRSFENLSFDSPLASGDSPPEIPLPNTRCPSKTIYEQLYHNHDDELIREQSISPLMDPGADLNIIASEDVPDLNIEEIYEKTRLDELRTAWEFIMLIKSASLDDVNIGLTDADIERLRKPPCNTIDAEIAHPDIHLSLDLFIGLKNCSQQAYTNACAAIKRRFPTALPLSYDQVKRKIADITGVKSMVHDMCVNSCVGFIGPFVDLEQCPKCGQDRYDQTILQKRRQRVARQIFHTVPIGPQLQALWRSSKSADDINYRERHTEEIRKELKTNHGRLFEYGDVFDGTAYLDAYAKGKIKPGDMVLMLSIDGAQLYCNKLSDCWIYIWVVLDYSPDLRYKKKYVLIGGFIPGPHKPKNIDSFLFPGIHHLSALQKTGLSVWDARDKVLKTMTPFLALATADGPAMSYLNGLVTHNGKCGCRLYCGFKGRLPPGGKHYFPVCLKPHNYSAQGSDHDDVKCRDVRTGSDESYKQNLEYVVASNSQAEYERRRLRTGICRPSIFLGLPESSTFGVPHMFGSDIMHL